jgi:hypothetical protein
MKSKFRVIVAGSRDFNDYNFLERKMDHLLSKITDDIVIVCGMAKGADILGEQYAKSRAYQIIYYPADWNIGKSAGYIRNIEMAENADALVAFWNGESRGTKHMIETAKKYHLQIRVIRTGENE